MRLRSRTLLEDIHRAGSRINEAVIGQSLATYNATWLIKSAVERQFEIIGEALARLERSDPELALLIADYRKIIGFRNRITHGYDDISDAQVWEIIDTFLPDLLSTVESLLEADDAVR